MASINGWEFIALIVLAVVILGPERLPEYAAKLGRLVRQARAMAARTRERTAAVPAGSTLVLTPACYPASPARRSWDPR